MTDEPGSTLADRMDGNYEPPILAEPKGGPIPDGEDQDGDEEEAPEPDPM